MSKVDLRQFDDRDEVTVILDSGEQFTGVLVDKDQDVADEYGKGFVSFVFEGDWWERINDRVDASVLHLRQGFERKTGEPLDTQLSGYVVTDEETGDTKYKPLGQVVEISKQ